MRRTVLFRKKCSNMRTRFNRTKIFGAHRFNAWELQNGALIVRAIQVSQHKIDMAGQKQPIECFHGIWQLNQLLLFESDHPMITLSKNQQGKGMCSHILHPMFPKILFFWLQNDSQRETIICQNAAREIIFSN